MDIQSLPQCPPDRITVDSIQMNNYIDSLSASLSENTRKAYLRRFELFENIYSSMGFDARFEFVIGAFIKRHSGVDVVGRSKLNPLNRAFLIHYCRCFKDKMDFIKSIPKIRTVITPERNMPPRGVIDQIIEHSSEKMSLMIRILFETGLRRAELMHLERKNINLAINRLKGIGKRGYAFSVIISENTKQLLEKYLNEQKDKEFPFHYDHIKNQDHKFWYDLKKECRKMGIDEITPHMVRHSLGRFLRIERKQDLEVIRGILRHSKLETTKIYVMSGAAERENIIKKEIFGEEVQNV